MKTQPETLRKGLGAFVRRAMAEWKVPGLAVAVVKGGRTIFAEGFGLRDVKGGLAVTPQTLFAVGSVTKAFTATALGVLVDEGKLGWDTPVRDVLGGFRLRDPVATERATVRDLLCHRTGLPRHDNVWYALKATREELAGRLRHLEPSKDFRARWQYQNLMYVVAGMAIEALAGQSWEAFVAERILQPLGMTAANFSVADSQAVSDFAMPCRPKAGRTVRTDFYELGPLAPAGGINASVAEMARWLSVNLSGGRRRGRRIVSAEALKEIHSPQAVVPDQPAWTELRPLTYALGWNVHPYRGHLALTHGGQIDGFQAGVGLLPGRKLGVVVLTNLMGHPVPDLVIYHAFDRLLGLEPVRWLARLRAEAARNRKAQAARKRKEARARRGSARPSRPLGNFAGRYEHPGYGAMTVERKGKALQAAWRGLAHTLRHCHHDVFELQRLLWDPPRMLSFLADAEGRIDRLIVHFEPAVDAIVFTRTAEQ